MHSQAVRMDATNAAAGSQARIAVRPGRYHSDGTRNGTHTKPAARHSNASAIAGPPARYDDTAARVITPTRKAAATTAAGARRSVVVAARSSGVMALLRLEHARRVPLDDVVSGGQVADVADAVQLVRGLEDDRPGPDALQLAVHERLDRPLLDDQQLLVRMFVRRMRRLARVERRDVDLELVERSGRRLHDGPHLAGPVRFGGHRLPVEDLGTEDGRFGGCRGDAQKGQRRRDRRDEEISAGHAICSLIAESFNARSLTEDAEQA